MVIKCKRNFPQYCCAGICETNVDGKFHVIDRQLVLIQTDTIRVIKADIESDMSDKNIFC